MSSAIISPQPLDLVQPHVASLAMFVPAIRVSPKRSSLFHPAVALLSLAKKRRKVLKIGDRLLHIRTT